MSLGVKNPDELDVSLSTLMQSVIEDEQPPGNAIIAHNEGVDLLPSNIELSGMETGLFNDMKSFRAIISTATGPVFYSWIFGFGGNVSIKAPEDVKEEYAKLVFEAAEAVKKT